MADWGVVWDLSATRPGNQSRHEFISKNDEPYEGNGVLRIGARHSYEQYTFQVGEPTFNGDEATLTAKIVDRPVEFKLKNFGGVWKIYPLKADPLEILRGYNEEEQKKKLEADLKSTFEKIKDESGRKNSRQSGLLEFR